MDSNIGTRTKLPIVVLIEVRNIQFRDIVAFLDTKKIRALIRSEIRKTTDGDDFVFMDAGDASDIAALDAKEFDSWPTHFQPITCCLLRRWWI